MDTNQSELQNDEVKNEGIENISLLIRNLQSPNEEQHLDDLKHLHSVLLKDPTCKDLMLQNNIIRALSKFIGQGMAGEKFDVSVSILHALAVQSGVEDNLIRVRNVTEPLLQMIFSKDEDISRTACKSLGDLINENKEIRQSLIKTGFAELVRYSLENDPNTTSIFIQDQLLEIVLKLIEFREDLESFKIIIPALESLLKFGDDELKQKAERILYVFNNKGIQQLSAFREKEFEAKIQELEDYKKYNEEELLKKDEQIWKLKEENDKIKQKSIIDQSIPIDVNNPDVDDIIFTDIDGTRKKISKKLNKSNTIPITNVLDEGVYAIEVEFFNTHSGCAAIGIVRDSYDIPANTNPKESPHRDHIAFYGGKAFGGSVQHKGSKIAGNIGFGDNQVIRAELDTSKGRLTFFAGGIQVPFCVDNVNEKIYMEHPDSYCIIWSLKKFAKPSAVLLANRLSVSW